MRYPRKSAVIVASVAFFAGGASGAVAYWTSAGAGAGDAAVGEAQPVMLSPGTPGSPLYPGTAVAVEVTVTNPNEGATNLGSIALDTSRGTGGFGVDGAHAACDVATLGFATQTNGGAGWDLPAREGTADGSLDISLPAALSMSDDADNACQGASFTVHIKAGL